MDDPDNNEKQLTIDIEEKSNSSDIVRDEMWLMCSVVKWCAFAVLTGVMVGLVCGGFLLALRYSMAYA